MTSFHQNDEISVNAGSSDCKNTIPTLKTFVAKMSTPDQVLERHDDIIKSENDKRSYRGLVLSNKLKVLLISDPKTDKSAAALDVNIGFLHDPNDVLGLAHFCEHMLFLGTEKYPKQNDYSKYLSENGGLSNAMTQLDHTTFFFDVSPKNLEPALDRFAQFFLAPLFTEALAELELNAIHSEHLQHMANDTWRLNQMSKSSADPNHPYSKFGTGNKETLEIIPKQKGINIRQKLLEFHEKYYSANIMALCVLGQESLDELEKLVVDLFSEIRNKEVVIPEVCEHPFKDEHFRTKWYIVPVKNIRDLHITFPVPDFHKFYQASPLAYISHLLGHEGEGSLLSALKRRGWCNSLQCGKLSSARGFSFLSIVVDLTENGFQHIDDIITLMFQYIKMIEKEGPVEWIYNEYRDIADVSFRFMEKKRSQKYVLSRVESLQDYPLKEVLCADHLFTQWRPDLINTLIKYLTPQNIRVQILAKAYEGITNEVEHWYGTAFKKEKIPSNIINMWENVEYNSEFHLPAKNEFIPTKLDIKPHGDNIKEFPTIIEDTPFTRLWFKQDDEFLVPKAKLLIDFMSPLAYLDPISCNLANMFILLFRDSFTEYAYPAELAGLHWELANMKYGLTLIVSGYDDKQRLLLEKILDRMLNFKIDSERFEILKENYVRDLKNFKTEQPYHHAVYYLAALLAEQVWTKDELLEATAYLTTDKVQRFITQLFSKIHVEGLIHGNVIEQEAIDIMRLIESKLKSTMPFMIPLWQRQLILSREIKLDNGCHFLYEVENKFHESSCAQVYYQSGMQSTETNMLIELVEQIIAEPCYDVLRTQEQLGYIVFSGLRKASGTIGLKILVQSDRHPQYVEGRINLFMKSMLDCISNMSEEEFEKHKSSLATLRLERPKKMSSLTDLFWSEITTQQYKFDRVNIEVAHLKTITQEELINFYKKIIYSEIRHKVSVHVISHMCNESIENDKSDSDDKNANAENIPIERRGKKINDIMAFKYSQSFYPLLEPYVHEFPRKGVHTSKL